MLLPESYGDILPKLGFTALALLIGSILNAIYNIYFHPLSNIPGPRSWSASRLPFIKALLSGSIIHEVEKLHQQYGHVVRIAPNEVTFAHPEAWYDILQPPSGKTPPFLKDTTWFASQPGMAQTILSAIQPEPHARIRKLFAPAFTSRALRDQEPVVIRYASLLVERLHQRVAASGEGVVEMDICPWFHFTTFDILGDLGFGESFTCLENSRYHPWIKLVYDSVKAATWVASARFYPWFEFVLLKALSPLLRKVQMQHLQLITDKVQRRLNWELERPDIMSHVIRGGKAFLSMDELSSNFMILANAGSETTATTLGGTLNYLVNNPDKLEILVKEIRGTYEDESEISLDTLSKLPYLNAVLMEGLRLCPPIPWFLPRIVPEGGATVCGTWLPEGTPVSIQPYAMYRNPAYFHHATSFLPERWLVEARTTDPGSPFSNDKREAVQPFAVGPRSCLGQHLAWAELRTILSKLLYAFDFEAAGEEGSDKRMRWEDLRTFLLVEKKPIQVVLRSRT